MICALLLLKLTETQLVTSSALSSPPHWTDSDCLCVVSTLGAGRHDAPSLSLNNNNLNMEPSLDPSLTEMEHIWSLLLLCSSLLLNLVALVVLVRWAGSCHSDPVVPPLISVTGELRLKPHHSTPHTSSYHDITPRTLHLAPHNPHS